MDKNVELVKTCSTIKTNANKVIKHPSGYHTIISCPVTRSGIFLYDDPRYPNGIRRELRPHDEVFSEKSLATLDSLPITSLHPDVGIVTSYNFKGVDYIGTTHPEIELANALSTEDKLISDGIIRAKLTLYDEESIKKFQNKEFTGFSLGYNCKRHYIPGKLENGQEYDSYQSDIVYNHLAAVERGRYGIDVYDNYMVDSFDFDIEKKVKIFDMKTESSNPLSEVAELKATLDATRQALEQQKSDNQILHEKISDFERKEAELVTKDAVGDLVKEKLDILALAQKVDSTITTDSVVTNHEAVVDSLFNKVAPDKKGLSHAEKYVYLNALNDAGYFNKKVSVGDSLTHNTINQQQKNLNSNQNRFETMRLEYLKDK